jgi:hypothetical protein
VGHLRSNGYPVKIVDTEDMAPVRRRHGVPSSVEGCHTALVEGYVLEGHVPADLIDRLLRERPKIAGLAVAGMPAGSPGMETSGKAEPYKVWSFDRSGKTAVYATR